MYVVKHRYYLLQVTTVLHEDLHSFFEAQAVVITAETTKTASRMFFIDYILFAFFFRATVFFARGAFVNLF